MMNNNVKATPFVSFIIPAYNVPEEMLRECIESILKLSLRPYEREIILVDDGSDSSPLNTLGDLKDVLIYVRQQNAGLSCARNTGLRMATGSFVQFVDADDYLVTATYEHVLDIVRFQHTDIVMFDFTTNPVPNASYTDEETVSGCELLHSSNIHGTACGYLFARQVAGSLGFTPGIYHEDEEFTPLLLLRADTVVRTTVQAYFYRQRENSITSGDDARKVEKRLGDFLGVILRLSHQAATLPATERVALQRRVHQLTMDYIYNVITLTHSRHYLDRRIEELRREGLYPLPDRDYTTKYKWFRRLANSSVGLTILFRMLTIKRINRLID